MKRTVFLLVLLAAVNAFAQTNVSVGAWNIQWLGNPDQRSGCAKDINQDPEDIALYIAQSRVDILALEEIGDTDGSAQTRTNRTLDRVVDILNDSSGNDWKYLLFAKRSLNSPTQLTGVMWNDDKVDKVGDPYRIEFDLPNSSPNYWDRWATAVKFRFGNNKTDVVVIPVHMKANVGTGNHVLQRQREAEFLVNELTSIRSRFSDQDIIILGDTNILNRNEAAATKLTNAGFVDLNNADSPTTTEGSAPFDRAFVTRNQPEFSVSALDVFKPPLQTATKNEFKIKFSDHYMVRFLVRVMNDDD